MARRDDLRIGKELVKFRTHAGYIAAMPSTTWGYRNAVRVGVALTPAVGVFNPRLRAAVQARRHAGRQLFEWAQAWRDRARPLAWFHASSVGEGLQARSVLLPFRRLCPGCQVVYTHFSPSAERLATQIEADATDYLPYDFPGNVDRLLRALNPDLLVFVKLDLWPELSTRAAAMGTDVAIVAATVSPGSGRLRWPVRSMLQPGYRAITAAAAIAPEDGKRLERLGVSASRIRILGDPRFDSVADRVRRVAPDEPLLRLGRGGPTLVAGSTWPADETVLLQAFARLRQQQPTAQLIVVPHEPTADHLARFECEAAAAGLSIPARLSAAGGPAPLLLVDRMGVLASLYGAATMAYVGGGFGSAGLHSVLEPAAWGLPVTFGPRWTNSRDAQLLLEAGGGTALPSGRVETSVAALEKLWGDWIREEPARREQGRRAREVVERGRGASDRSAEMLMELISSRSPRMSRNAERSGPQSAR